MTEVVTIDQVRDLIKAEKIKPSDLFGVETLTGDPTVIGYVEAEKKKAVAGEYAHRKRTEEGFDKTRDELEGKLKEREAELQKLKVDAAKAQVGSLFLKQKDERRLDEKQVKFVQSRLAKFTPTKVEDLEKELNAHLDAEIDEYKRIAKDVFGVEEKTDGDDKGKHGVGPDEKPKETPADKYLDPAQNPFIKTTGEV
jgi:hypothetical protein